MVIIALGGLKEEKIKSTSKNYLSNPGPTTVVRKGFQLERNGLGLIRFEQRQWFQEQTSARG